MFDAVLFAYITEARRIAESISCSPSTVKIFNSPTISFEFTPSTSIVLDPVPTISDIHFVCENECVFNLASSSSCVLQCVCRRSSNLHICPSMSPSASPSLSAIPDTCSFDLSVCYVVDESGSISPNDFKNLKDFVIKTEESFR